MPSSAKYPVHTLKYHFKHVCQTEFDKPFYRIKAPLQMVRRRWWPLAAAAQTTEVLGCQQARPPSTAAPEDQPAGRVTLQMGTTVQADHAIVFPAASLFVSLVSLLRPWLLSVPGGAAWRGSPSPSGHTQLCPVTVQHTHAGG